jgi:predicted GH43/DUF377 family glycosyl hydrolase
MKHALLALLTLCLTLEFSLQAIERIEPLDTSNQIVTATKRIHLDNCPGAYNPSIIRYQDGYLMSFRWSPNRIEFPWISFIGIVLLDDSFEVISKPELLDTRWSNDATPSQAEDARIIDIDGKIYVIYNDNMDIVFPNTWERRDMYMAEILIENDQVTLLEPIKLLYEAKYRSMPWQKNWNPFIWKNQLLLSYSINPHEVLVPDLQTGACQRLSETEKYHINWDFGGLRGGTPAVLVDGEYLSFFHSGEIKRTPCSDMYDIWHYYMGACTYGAEPPFELKKISNKPIDAVGFYTYSHYSKRVIYPGGFVLDGENIYLSYGKDDAEMWIATINLAKLKASMVDVN